MKFQEYIKHLRESRNLSLRDLSLELGFSFVFIGEVERGVKPPSEKFVRKFAEVFQVEPVALLILANHVPRELVEFAERDFTEFSHLVQNIKTRSTEEIINLTRKVRDGVW